MLILFLIKINNIFIIYNIIFIFGLRILKEREFTSLLLLLFVIIRKLFLLLINS
jgi:hypothetical protein